MAEVIKKFLRWTPSLSPDVVAVQIFVSTPGGSVDLTSQSWTFPAGSAQFDNAVAEIPTDLPGFPQIEDTYEIGVMAIDDVGNKADMAVLSSPFDFDAPAPVTDLVISDD